MSFELTKERWQLDLGARPVGPSSVRFRVWAPHARNVAVRLVGKDQQLIPMEPRELGYFEVTASGVGAEARYVYVLDGDKDRPDPASRFQPEGVHGASAVVDPESFYWTDHQWSGLPLSDFIIYELHTGTFTSEGTFQAIIPCLDYLQNEVGVTAIELMPVAQFPGTRNWGYDGVCPFAPQVSYGGPRGLKTLVDACHARGMAVILDVVYNHLGPEGNYLGDFGPYFTDRYRTPWGQAINYDGPDSDEVRRFVISNALYWVMEYHIDALRLDAVHGIFDYSPRHLLRDIADDIHAQAARVGRGIQVIAESDLNDVRVISPVQVGGYGLDAQWNDDFHHALHGLLTGEHFGYYEDFGRLDQLATALREGYIYSGQRSTHRRRRHGNSSRGRPPRQFVVCAQNHDQIGNRAFGERLSTLVSFEALKVAAAAVLLAPNIPLVFMGEEYGETAPFQYFIEHEDPVLIEAVRKGRLSEFASFGWKEIPDPQDPATFERSRVRPEGPKDSTQTALLSWYRALIGLRKSIPALGAAEEGDALRVWSHDSAQVLTIHRRGASGPEALLILGFGKQATTMKLCEPEGRWALRLHGSATEFGGPGRSGPPETLTITRDGATVPLPGYGVLLYLTKGRLS